MTKQRVGAISQELSRLSQDDQLSGEEKAKIDTIRAEVSAKTRGTIEEIASLADGPDYLAASERLGEIAKQFEKTPVVADVKAMRDRFKKDKAIARELRAMKELAAYRKRHDAKKRSGRKKLLQALGGFVKKYEGTHAAERAGELVLKVGTMR